MNLQSLTANKLTCLRGGCVVFRDLSFSVVAGKALALEGANGSGKSSLLRMLAGFLPPAAGTIALHDGASKITEGEERGKHVGWLGHLDAAKPQMTVLETLQFFARFYGTPGSAEAIRAALDSAGIARLTDIPCQYLSAGQKKRLALARLQLSARSLWLMDEPFAALDTEGKALVITMVAAHCARGGIAIVATHDVLGIAGERLTLGMA